MTLGIRISYASSGPPGSRLATAAGASLDRAAAVGLVRLSPPAGPPRVTRTERTHAWIGLSLVVATTAISLYDTYLLATLALR
ncbi:MAG: hypothetical protein QOE28_2869 [Solirubrobacteraceae bacterium]|nr:hypothetical protein [Solirubrobacteraceae bacterium]